MRRYRYILFVMLLAALLSGCGKTAKSAKPAEQTETKEEEEKKPEATEPTEPTLQIQREEQAGQARQAKAVYLGVENYGAEEVNKEHKDDFRYRFQIDGQEEIFSIDNGVKDGEGNYGYPIQNVLKEGYSYEITVADGTVTEARQAASDGEAPYKPPVSGAPGEKTLKNFLSTALEPVGTALYIYGGGWDWQDKGSSVQATTLGVSMDWVRFFERQDENFTYRDKDGNEANQDAASSYYPYGGYNEYYYAGLDCSGYVGWALYNTFESEDGRDGYVMAAADMAKYLSEAGWGPWTRDVSEAKNSMRPGDIMSLDGHVWISLGTCADGSIAIVHSTPSDSRSGQPGGGVQLGAIGTDENCEAYRLADYYMTKFYPEWHSRYPTALKETEGYFAFTDEAAGRFSWDVTGAAGGLADPEGMQQMSPAETLTELFGEAPDFQ